MAATNRSDDTEPQPADVAAPESFDDFYLREHDALVAVAYALCGHAGTAEDIVQDAFVDALAKWNRIDHPAAWIRRVISNKSMSLFRRRATEGRRLLLHRTEPPAPEPELHREVAELWAEIRRLPRRQSQAIALHYVDGSTVAEIADILSVSENTVKTHLQRARAALAEHRSEQP